MTETVSIRSSGAHVFWSPAEWTILRDFNLGLEEAGLAQFHAEKRTEFACLKDAVEDMHSGRDFLVEALESDNDVVGFEVRRIVRGKQNNDYHLLRTLKIDRHRSISVDPYGQQIATDLLSRYNAHLGKIRAGAVTGILVKILKHFGGTTLKPTGGFYWIPEDRVEEWKRVAAVAYDASLGTRTRCYTCRMIHDAESMRAVRDALTLEVQEAVFTIQKEVQSGELGARALETRKQAAIELRKKVALYEELLETGLEPLTRIAEEAEAAAADAALSLAAGAA